MGRAHRRRAPSARGRASRAPRRRARPSPSPCRPPRIPRSSGRRTDRRNTRGGRGCGRCAPWSPASCPICNGPSHATGLVPTMYWGQTPPMRVPGTVQRRTLARALPALALLVTGVATVPATSAAGATSSAHGTSYRTTTYRNPVSRSFADTYADPDVVRGKDGWWYAYATTDPLRAGETTPHLTTMSKLDD